MTALVVIGALVVVGVLVAGSRRAIGRSERRSMKSYEHTLEVLGQVTRRSEAEARTRGGGRATAPGGAAERPVTRPLARRPPPRPGGAPLSFGGDEAPPEAPQPNPPSRRGARGGRPIALAAAVLVIAVGAVVGLDELAHHGGSPSSRNPPGGHHAEHSHSPSKGTTPSTAAPTTTRPPSTLLPVSTSSTDVAFVAPTGPYTVGFAGTGACWVGIQKSAGGSYVWEKTLAAGQTASYRATGPIVIRIGAPEYIRVSVDGRRAKLPGLVQPYDVTLTPSSSSSS